jgi:hypothetical protein
MTGVATFKRLGGKWEVGGGGAVVYADMEAYHKYACILRADVVERAAQSVYVKVCVCVCLSFIYIHGYPRKPQGCLFACFSQLLVDLA